MKFACQTVWVLLMVGGFLANVYWDINGRPAREPSGFAGVVGTIVIYALSIAMGFGAGVYQEFFK